MQAKDLIRHALTSSPQMVSSLLGDLSDADLLVRPAPKANHIAWQLGHLVVSEVQLLSVVPGAKVPELPAGFAERHRKETAAIDPPTGFATKAKYLDLLGRVRAASLAALEQLPEADLDRPNEGSLKAYAPTVGALFLLIGNHPVMHVGQFTVVRRKLGKPVLF